MTPGAQYSLITQTHADLAGKVHSIFHVHTNTQLADGQTAHTACESITSQRR